MNTVQRPRRKWKTSTCLSNISKSVLICFLQWWSRNLHRKLDLEIQDYNFLCECLHFPQPCEWNRMFTKCVLHLSSTCTIVSLTLSQNKWPATCSRRTLCSYPRPGWRFCSSSFSSLPELWQQHPACRGLMSFQASSVFVTGNNSKTLSQEERVQRISAYPFCMSRNWWWWWSAVAALLYGQMQPISLAGPDQNKHKQNIKTSWCCQL